MEVAIFEVEENNVQRALVLSKLILEEMNESEKVINTYKLMQKTDKSCEICWYITWVSASAAKLTTEKWPTFPSTKEFQGLVKRDLYYGHFYESAILL